MRELCRVYSFLDRSTGILGHNTINNRFRYEELGDRERNAERIEFRENKRENKRENLEGERIRENKELEKGCFQEK